MTGSLIDQAGPTWLAFLRYLVAGGCLVPFVLLAPAARLRGADLVLTAILGLGQFAVLVVLLNWSLQFVSPGRAALLFTTMPIMVLLIVAAARREAAPLTLALGVILTVVGVAVVLAGSALANGRDTGWLGDAAALASALIGAVCSLLYRPLLRRYSTVSVSAVAMLAAVVGLGVLAILGPDSQAPVGFGLTEWLAVAFIGLSSAVGYFSWLWALGRARATQVTAFLALGPITATALGTLMLGESVPPSMLLGIGLVAAGLALAYRPEW